MPPVDHQNDEGNGMDVRIIRYVESVDQLTVIMQMFFFINIERYHKID